mmetsp:Transcript_7420/g.26434  ORF Transcript_7420/g.26434 Transcript_7420/m.26434 type:complete len:84 (+) Transcript_7420:681-932(+)
MFLQQHSQKFCRAISSGSRSRQMAQMLRQFASVVARTTGAVLEPAAGATLVRVVEAERTRSPVPARAASSRGHATWVYMRYHG